MAGERGAAQAPGPMAPRLKKWGRVFLPKIRKKGLAHLYFLELFSGSANLSKAMAARGLKSRGVDIQYPESNNDILDPVLLQQILSDIKHGRVAAVWGGMPCETFSAAVFGPYRLRNYGEFVDGLPDLPPHRQAKLENANRILKNMTIILGVLSALPCAFLF